MLVASKLLNTTQFIIYQHNFGAMKKRVGNQTLSYQQEVKHANKFLFKMKSTNPEGVKL